MNGEATQKLGIYPVVPAVIKAVRPGVGPEVIFEIECDGLGMEVSVGRWSDGGPLRPYDLDRFAWVWGHATGRRRAALPGGFETVGACQSLVGRAICVDLCWERGSGRFVPSVAPTEDETAKLFIDDSSDRPVLGTVHPLELPMAATQWEYDNLLARRGGTLLVGPKKAGKSLLALLVSICRALGLPVFGFPCRGSACCVLYFDGENPPGESRARFEEICRGLGVAPETVNLRILPPALFRHGTVFKTLRRLVRENNAELVVLDSMRRVLRGEETAGAVAEVFEEITYATRDWAAVLALHHTGKRNEGPRGSGDFEAWPGLVLGLSRVARDRSRRVLEVNANRFSAFEGPLVTYDEQWANDAIRFVPVVAGLLPAPGPTAQPSHDVGMAVKFLAAVRGSPGISVSAAIETFQGKKTAKLAAAHGAISAGLVFRNGKKLFIADPVPVPAPKGGGELGTTEEDL